MLFFNPATVFGLVLALLVSLFASSPAPATGTPTAAALAPRATVALEKPQFPRVSLNLLLAEPLRKKKKKNEKKEKNKKKRLSFRPSF